MNTINTNSTETIIKDIDKQDRISLSAFVDRYIHFPVVNKAAKEKAVKEIISIKYAPYIQKLVLIETMLKASVVTDEDTGIPYIDNNTYYINLWMGIIALYTKLATKTKEYDAYQAYDLLVSSGLMGEIVKAIGETEIEEITQISKNACDTFIARNCTPAVILHKDFNRTLTAIEKPITKVIDSLIDTMDNHPQKIVDIINKIIKK